MAKGKKKANKGKKSSRGKKTSEETSVGDSSTCEISEEQYERAILAAANRTEDPLKNWKRIQNEECPICMLPLPYDASDINYCFTCGKTVCMGCVIGTAEAHRKDGGDVEKAVEKATTCPYCRSDTASYDDKSRLEQELKRANAGNPRSINYVGGYYFDGEMGLRQDKAEGLKWFHRAVEAGSGDAAFSLGIFYEEGDGVEQDDEKALEYYQNAAEHGIIFAFDTLGHFHMTNGDIENGMLNFRKAVMSGMSDDCLFDLLRSGFREGLITKDEYAFTLRENQKACNEMKSDGRERWKRFNTSP